MAVTAIWDVKGYIGDVLVYVQNPEKTTNPDFYKTQEFSKQERQGMFDVIELAMKNERADDLKNVLDYTMQDEKTDMQQYVSGVNCLPETARYEMVAVKKRFGKVDGTVAFHGYQSFATGEVTPNQAHEIGIKLAEQLWRDKFQVIVTTHLDKESHIHNHFVLNSVSYVDGKRYNDCKATYRLMRETSDNLCREYGLSVIENPKQGKTKPYVVWQAEKENKPTLRSIIQSDVDQTIKEAVTEKQFFFLLRQKGYQIKMGKDITLRPPDRKYGLKLQRNFGDEYSFERIVDKIYETKQPDFTAYTIKKVKYKGVFSKAKKRYTGIRALYYHYLFKMGILPKNKKKKKRPAPYIIREDLIKLNIFKSEMKLLTRRKIQTGKQLFLYKKSLEKEMKTLTSDRTKLRNKCRRETNFQTLSQLKGEISESSKRLAFLRKEVKLCKGIEENTKIMKEKLCRVKQDEQERKERKSHELIR